MTSFPAPTDYCGKTLCSYAVLLRDRQPLVFIGFALVLTFNLWGFSIFFLFSLQYSPVSDWFLCNVVTLAKAKTFCTQSWHLSLINLLIVETSRTILLLYYIELIIIFSFFLLLPNILNVSKFPDLFKLLKYNKVGQWWHWKSIKGSKKEINYKFKFLPFRKLPKLPLKLSMCQCQLWFPLNTFGTMSDNIYAPPTRKFQAFPAGKAHCQQRIDYLL